MGVGTTSAVRVTSHISASALTSAVVVHASMVVVYTAAVVIHAAMIVVSGCATLVATAVVIVISRSVSVVTSRHVISSASVNTVVMWSARSGMSYMRSVCWTHGMEIPSSAILVVMPWHAVVVVGVACIVSVDAESPSIICKYDRTIEVVVGDVSSPLCSSEETTEGEVAVVEYVVVLCVSVSQSHVVEVFVHAVDVVEVDHIHCVDDIRPQGKRESHTVGQEPCVVAHHSVGHDLCVHHISHCQHCHCYKDCSNLSHSRYFFVESVGVFLRVLLLG